MRTNFTLVFLVLCHLTNAQDPEQDITSAIKQVTVFLEGAQVTRQANVSLKPGISILRLTGISPHIQEQSIQVESPSVKILSVAYKLDYLDENKRPERLAVLEKERRRLLTLIAKEKGLEEVYKEEESILKTNRSIGGASKGVEVEELKVAMEYFRQRLTDIKQKQLDTDQEIRKYNEALGKIEAQLKELSQTKQQPAGVITIKVSSRGFVAPTFSVRYFVQEARWFPSYDIRVKNIQSPVSITYKAIIAQQTGEKWEDVVLTVSSANPNQIGTRPIIKPWFVGFDNTIEKYRPTIATLPGAGMRTTANNLIAGRVTTADGEGMPGVNVVIKGTTVGTVTDAHGYYSLTLTSEARTLVFSFIGYMTQEMPVTNDPTVNVAMHEEVAQLSEVVVMGYGEATRHEITGALAGRVSGVQARNKKIPLATPVVRQTNVEFTLGTPFSIDSDGEQRTTDMIEYELKALYEYYCAPKLDPDAFLMAKLLDWDEFNFLDGEASLFFEGKYIGKSIMDTRNTSDTLTLSLGRDANVLVTREKIKDLSSRQFIGSNQKMNFAYDITIRNKKSQSLIIVIEDQIPVPNTREITVDKMEDSAAIYRETTGLLQWKREVQAGHTEKIQLKYAVRYPKNSQMILE